MSEFTEMIVEGILCETCGVFIEGDPPGHPRNCEDCKIDDPARPADEEG